MPTFRARITRLLIKNVFGPKFRRAEGSVMELRKLDDFFIRSQRLPRGTRVSPVSVNGLAAEWTQGPGACGSGALLYLHGGGFVMGSPATHRELAARIATAVGVRVLSLDYRLAPEHPFPAALEDTKRAYRWLLDQGHEPASIVIGGESSGAGLALQALLSIRDEEIPMPRAGFFLSPVTDWIGLDGESYTSRATVDPLVSLAQCQYSAALYVGDQPKDTPLLRPAEMSLAGLPPIWIQAGDHEVLLSDAQRLAQRANEDGVEVAFKVWPGMWHLFQGAARFVPEARDSIEELGRWVRKRLLGPN